MESEDDTEELSFLSKPRWKLAVLPVKSISFYKQKFDCFLSSVGLKADRFPKNLLKNLFHFNSAAKPEGNDNDLIEILSSREGSPEMKR